MASNSSSFISKLSSFWRGTLFLPKRLLEKNCLKEMGLLYHKNRDKEEILTSKEFYKIFEVEYLDHLLFAKEQYLIDVTRRAAKAKKNFSIDNKQLWQGSFYSKNFENGFLPPVTIGYIDILCGYGLFAKERIFPNQFIGEYVGVVRKRTSQDERNPYCFEYTIGGTDTPYLVDAREMGNHMRFVNHSIQPNLTPSIVYLEGVAHIIFHAKKEIQKGEQLTYDYGPFYWKKREKPISL